MSEDIRDAAVKNREASVAILKTRDPKSQFFESILSLSMTLQKLGTIPKSDPNSSSLGTFAFHSLAHVTSSMVMNYPPAKKFLETWLEKLGTEFILNNPAEPERVLRCLLQDVEIRGKLMEPFFEPNLQVSKFPDLYQMICNGHILNPLQVEFFISLFSRFKIDAWEKVENQQVAGDVIQCAVASLALSRDFKLEECHVPVITLLGNRHFPTIFPRLIKSCLDNEIRVEIWRKFLGTFQLENVTRQVVLEVSQIFHTFLWQLRQKSESQGESLFVLWKDFISIFTDLVRTMIRSPSVTPHHSSPMAAFHYSAVDTPIAWDCLIRFYDPWIRNPGQLWRSQDIEQTTMIIRSFVTEVSFLGNHFHVIYQHLWNIIGECLRDLQNLPDHVPRMFQSEMRIIPWEDFTPTTESLRWMNWLFSFRSNGATSDLVNDCILRSRWDTEGMASATSEFLYQVLILTIRCLEINPLPFGERMIRFLDTINRFSWASLPSDHFSHAISESLQKYRHIESENRRLVHLSHVLSSIAGYHTLKNQALDDTAENLSQKLRIICGAVAILLSNPCDDSTVILSLDRIFHHIFFYHQMFPHRAEDLGLIFLEILKSLDHLKQHSQQRHFYEAISKYPMFSEIIMNLIPTSVSSVDVVAEAIEVCLDASLSSKKPWDSILLSFPSERSDDLMRNCIANGLYLTVFAQWTLRLQKIEMAQDLRFSAALDACIAMISTIQIERFPDRDFRILPCWNLMIFEMARHFEIHAQDYAKANLLINWAHAIWKMSDDRKGDGIWKALGKGEKSSLDPRFRIICKSLSGFILTRCSMTGIASRRATDPLPITRGFEKQMSGLFNSWKTNPEYAKHSALLDEIQRFLQDPSKTLRNVDRLSVMMAKHLYSSVSYLPNLVMLDNVQMGLYPKLSP
eukprot:TRINITY_DN3352_c1_g4_i1.p1 TRINITY_DN3352_c1_g4~~TRINITY_DN3352_c1_g4_i1.p1  ORF type:complete len:1003 (+),score=265.63 TRINITY_DN3352_c1_g4_i1:281-3010(+)